MVEPDADVWRSAQSLAAGHPRPACQGRAFAPDYTERSKKAHARNDYRFKGPAMMTLDELTAHISSARWFSNLGRFEGGGGFIAITTMEAWRSEDTIADAHHEQVAENMEWLPSVYSGEPDPIHGNSLKLLAKELGKEDEFKKCSLEAYKRALASMRSVAETPLLRAGPHNFNTLARSMAAYAARASASEITVSRQGFWCSLIPLYSSGNFPCGLMPDKTIVVF